MLTELKIEALIQREHAEERVMLRALEDCELSNYIIVDHTFDEHRNLSDKIRHSFWFPKQQVKAGDIIFLYTKSGRDRFFKNITKSTSYAYFWDIDSNVWNDFYDGVILIKIDSFTSKYFKGNVTD